MKNVIKADLLGDKDAATLTGGYDAISSTPNAGPAVILRIINDSNVDIEVSYDGVNSHDFIPANDKLELNFQANASPNNFVSMLRKGAKVYVNGSPGTGHIYLAVYYQEL